MKTFAAIAAATGFGLAAGAAQAGTISYDDAFEMDSSTTTAALSVSKFRPGEDGIPSDAYLVSAQVSLTAEMDAIYNFYCFTGTCNAASTEADGEYVSAVVEVNGDGLIDTLSIRPVGGYLGPLQLIGGTDGGDDNTPGNNIAHFEKSGITGQDEGDALLTLAEVTGPGNLNYDITATSDFTDSMSGGNKASGGETSFSGLLEVTYVYEQPTSPVPVPAALPLMASALGIFGVVRFRSKRR